MVASLCFAKDQRAFHDCALDSCRIGKAQDARRVDVRFSVFFVVVVAVVVIVVIVILVVILVVIHH